MTPLRILKQAVGEFEKRNCAYCLIGGHAASLYRSKERLTSDVDFAMASVPQGNVRETAEAIIHSLGLKPVLGFIAAGAGRSQAGRVSLVTSAPPRGELTGMIDILLPEVPWVTYSVQRAQSNKIDLGFAAVPVITPEDLIIAKCYAIAGAPDRFQDLDDLKHIFIGDSDLDCDYIKIKLEELVLSVPKALKPYAPALLRKLCR